MTQHVRTRLWSACQAHDVHDTRSRNRRQFLSDSTEVTFRLLAWLLSVRLSVCHGCTVAKRCKVGPKLLLIANRK